MNTQITLDAIITTVETTEQTSAEVFEDALTMLRTLAEDRQKVARAYSRYIRALAFWSSDNLTGNQTYRFTNEDEGTIFIDRHMYTFIIDGCNEYKIIRKVRIDE